jgi:hypothetical protein
MRRKKRLTIIRIGLALAALAIPAVGQAKPLPTDQSMAQYRLGPGEIPYRVDAQRVEIPYLSHGNGVTPAELGLVSGSGPDDRSHSRAEGMEAAVVTDDGAGIEINAFAATGVGLVLVLMAFGMGFAIWHSRRGKLSPA